MDSTAILLSFSSNNFNTFDALNITTLIGVLRPFNCCKNKHPVFAFSRII